MGRFSYLEVNFFSIAVLLLISLNSVRNKTAERSGKILNCLMVSGIFILFLDTVSWWIDGKSFSGADTLLWMVNTVYFIFTLAIPIGWFCYVALTLGGKVRFAKKRILLITLPLAVFLAMLFSSPHTKLIFYINEKNNYCRGSAYAFQPVLSFLYMLAASIKAAKHRKQLEQQAKRRECMYIILFPLLPFAGYLFQAAFYGTSLVWPCMALSLLIIYTDRQNQQISLDALTGLNNRGHLDKYLYSKCTNKDKQEPLHLILIDVDNFKGINDTYGHITGDNVLKKIAQALRKSFALNDALLARYGGDEFAVVMPKSNDGDIQKLAKTIDKNITEVMSADICTKNVTVSMGCASTSAKNFKTPGQLIADADKRMYDCKREKEFK